MTDMTGGHDIPELDTAGLRRFGLSTGAIVAVLFGLAIPLLFGLGYPRWPWIVAFVLTAWALAAPASLKNVYYYWMRFGLLLNIIVSPIVLGIVFFLVVTPMGLVMRMFRKDPMKQIVKSEEKTCRVQSISRDPSHLEKPY